VKIFRELLLEAADSNMVEKLKPLYDGLSQKWMDAAKDSIELLEKAVKEDKIFNVEFNEIKNTLSSCLEKVLTLHHNISRTDDHNNSPHMKVYMAGNLTSISELPYKKPTIKGGGGQLESGFLFEFADSSEFKVVTYAGKQFEQFPTTFHDVKFLDGTKMKIPSEEKMVKEFGEWKPK
jgi:hypothetical protein